MTILWIVAMGTVLSTLLVVFMVFLLCRGAGTRPRQDGPGETETRPPRDDLLTDHQLAHLAVVDQYRALLTEIIIAATHAAHCARRVDAAKLAEITSELCHALFDDDQEVNSHAVQRLLAGLDDHPARGRALCQAATAIRTQAVISGGEHRWKFAFVPGTDLDDTSQTPWRDCDPTLPVTAVVTPAYLVDGHVLCHQRVLTGQARDDDRV